jgi:hypothetical protein
MGANFDILLDFATKSRAVDDSLWFVVRLGRELFLFWWRRGPFSSRAHRLACFQFAATYISHGQLRSKVAEHRLPVSRHS